MRTLSLALLASAALVTAASAAPPRYARMAPLPPPNLSMDEVHEYQEEQMERRQEMERAALEMQQKAERRARGIDDDF